MIDRSHVDTAHVVVIGGGVLGCGVAYHAHTRSAASLGRAAGVGGFYILGADCEIGVTHGPGLGRHMAELVVQGQTSVDLSEYRLDRW